MKESVRERVNVREKDHVCERECVSVCVKERETVCVCVCVKEKDSVCLCERERLCVSV